LVKFLGACDAIGQFNVVLPAIEKKLTEIACWNELRINVKFPNLDVYVNIEYLEDYVLDHGSYRDLLVSRDSTSRRLGKRKSTRVQEEEEGRHQRGGMRRLVGL
jgi:hypothetical protein